ncbi:hypothetical protein QUB60_07185 [Microcoleus sp. A2-C5]|uniref:hypothetical protein n=1 Tax=Microcoleaceae TaxID=1892252 RepID=UPI002237BC50|nr:hypothetical protein [Lyngbya sp. CCAP 1446/10]
MSSHLQSAIVPCQILNKASLTRASVGRVASPGRVLIWRLPQILRLISRRKKEEGRRKKEEGRRKKEDGRRHQAF